MINVERVAKAMAKSYCHRIYGEQNFPYKQKGVSEKRMNELVDTLNIVSMPEAKAAINDVLDQLIEMSEKDIQEKISGQSAYFALVWLKTIRNQK